eukprot:TRINITY_DN3871_c0_g1_i1.p1 TRINITY_DN3871_c0_g1~~TRINITY_DN3871_c0_g1_i1.p1  ORF type:complete len:192 (+),score=15.16 TRINITY_DN3871_c0_g1_i1:214-789(+)
MLTRSVKMNTIAVLFAALCLVAVASAAITECGTAPSGCVFPSGTYDCNVQVPDMTITYTVTAINDECVFLHTTTDGSCNRVLGLEVQNGDLVLDYHESTCDEDACPFPCSDTSSPLLASGDTSNDGFCDFITFGARVGDVTIPTQCELKGIAGSVPDVSPRSPFSPSGSSAAPTVVPTAVLAVVVIAAAFV